MENIGLITLNIFDGHTIRKYNLEDDRETIIFKERQKVDGKFKQVEIGRSTLKEVIANVEKNHNITWIRISERIDIDKDNFKWRTAEHFNTRKMLETSKKEMEKMNEEIYELEDKIERLQVKVGKEIENVLNIETID